MSPKEEAQNSARRKEDYTAARINSISEDQRALKISKRIAYCERNSNIAIYYCYLALAMLELLGEIMMDHNSLFEA